MILEFLHTCINTSILVHIRSYHSYFCALPMSTWEMECGRQWCLVNSGTYPQSDLWVTPIYDSWDVKVAETDETHRRGNYLHTALHHQRLCFLCLGWHQNQDHPEMISVTMKSNLTQNFEDEVWNCRITLCKTFT